LRAERSNKAKKVLPKYLYFLGTVGLESIRTRSPQYFPLLFVIFLWPLCQRHKFAASVCELFTSKLREWAEGKLETVAGGCHINNTKIL